MCISGSFLTYNIAFCNHFWQCFVEKLCIFVKNTFLSTIFRQSIIHKISDRSRAEFAHFTRLNTILTHSSKTLTRILRKIFAHPKRRSPHSDAKSSPVAPCFRDVTADFAWYFEKNFYFLNKCPLPSVCVHIYYRGCNQPRAILGSTYTTHQQKKQRQVSAAVSSLSSVIYSSSPLFRITLLSNSPSGTR